jgi:hypothetical protein
VAMESRLHGLLYLHHGATLLDSHLLGMQYTEH